jgi:hypothetical protein
MNGGLVKTEILIHAVSQAGCYVQLERTLQITGVGLCSQGTRSAGAWRAIVHAVLLSTMQDQDVRTGTTDTQSNGLSKPLPVREHCVHDRAPGAGGPGPQAAETISKTGKLSGGGRLEAFLPLSLASRVHLF